MSKSNGVVWRQGPPPEEPTLGDGGVAFAIAIPARDEEALIGPCLEALAAQQDAPPFAVALVLNNCRDGTADVIRQLPDLPFALHVFEVELEQGRANAAWARRLAMNAALSLTHADGVVLTTDSDSRVDQHWAASIATCFAQGADLVCGFVAPDFADAPPLSFEAVRRGALEFEYSQLTAELCALTNPDAGDPWPNHLIETGANLAIRARALHALGGVPHVCPGEDQRLVEMARREGYRIRHAFAPSVTTSSRVRGRAQGGWSDDLQSRLTDDRAMCHPKLEAAPALMRRMKLRASLGDAFDAPAFARVVRRLASKDAGYVLAAPSFEAAWARLEEKSDLLQRKPLMAADLEASVSTLRNEVTRLTAPLAQVQSVVR